MIKNIKKIFSLSLAVLLLWPNIALAQEANRSLQDYQKQAKEAIAQKPGISTETKTLIAVAGSSLGLLILQKVVHYQKEKALHQEINRLSKELLEQKQVTVGRWRQLQKAEATHEQELQKALKAQEETFLETLKKEEALKLKALEEERAITARLEKELKTSKAKANGWEKSSIAQKNKYQQAVEAANAREAELLAEIEAIRSKAGRYKDYFTTLASYSTDIEKELVKYEPLFDRAVGQEQKNALLAELRATPWVKEMTEEQSKHFFKVLDDAIGISYGGSYQGAGHILLIGARQASQKAVPYYERFLAMGRNLFKKQKTTLIVFGLFSLLGATSAYAYETDSQAKRLTQNFDIFLNATPEELAVMEKNPDLRKICIEGTTMLLRMSEMSAEEMQELRKTTQVMDPGSPSYKLHKVSY